MRKNFTITTLVILACSIGLSNNNTHANSNLTKTNLIEFSPILLGVSPILDSIEKEIVAKEEEKKKEEERKQKEEERRLKNLKKEAKEKIKELDSIKKSNKKKYIQEYKKIIKKYEEVIDSPETIYDVIDSAELDFFQRIVSAEIEIGDFDAKCNVASVILNRVESKEFPNTITKVLKEHKQFSTYLFGTYKTTTPSKDTKLAIEYVWLFGDTTNGCTYFRSGKDTGKFHSTLDRQFNDGYHTFYK